LNGFPDNLNTYNNIQSFLRPNAPAITSRTNTYQREKVGKPAGLECQAIICGNSVKTFSQVSKNFPLSREGVSPYAFGDSVNPQSLRRLRLPTPQDVQGTYST